MSGTRRRTAVAVLLLPSALLAGCPGPSPDPPRQTPSRSVLVDHDGLEGLPGVVYLQGGRSPFKQSLYRLDFDPVRLTRLTDDERISAMGSCDRYLIVTAADPLADAAHRLEGNDLEQLPGLRRKLVQSPELSPSCELAFVQSPNDVSTHRYRAIRWDIEKQRGRTVLVSERDVGDPVWAPDGSLALLQRDGKGSRLVFPDDAGRTIDLGHRVGLGDFNRQGWFAGSIRGKRESSLLIAPDGTRRVVSGWFPLAWSPDGRYLLVFADGGRTFGLAKKPGFRRVEEVARLRIPLYGAEWMPHGV